MKIILIYYFIQGSPIPENETPFLAFTLMNAAYVLGALSTLMRGEVSLGIVITLGRGFGYYFYAENGEGCTLSSSSNSLAMFSASSIGYLIVDSSLTILMLIILSLMRFLSLGMSGLPFLKPAGKRSSYCKGVL